MTTDPQARVRFLTLPDFLISSGSGTGPTQPREYNWGAAWKRKYGLRSIKLRIRPQGSVTLTTWHPLSVNLALTSSTSNCSSIGKVRSPTQVTDLNLFYDVLHSWGGKNENYCLAPLICRSLLVLNIGCSLQNDKAFRPRKLRGLPNFFAVNVTEIHENLRKLRIKAYLA
jgi:hypothetical protein